MITLILNGQLYGPDSIGENDVLILGEKIARIGRIDRAAVEAIGVDVEIIDASGCLVTPGFIDPHEHLAQWLRFYFDNDGDASHLTISSDASLSSPLTLYEQLRGCVLEHKFPLEQVLPLVTTNTARILKLETKGTLDTGKDADVLVLRKDSLEIVEVIAGGRRLVADGRLNVEEPFLKQSTRRFSLEGKKH